MADEQSIEITGLPEGHPPLMIFVDERLSPETRARISSVVSQAIRDRRIVVFEPSVTVYQMTDGRWQLIHADA